MSENVTTPEMPDTSPIRRLIRRTRRLLRSSWVVTGLGLAVGLLLGTLVAATLVDLVMPLQVALRMVALLAVVVPAGWVLLVGVVRPLFRRLSAVMVARRIESRIPGIHNRLVSSLDLSDPKQKQPVSQAFYRRLLQEALSRIGSFRPSSVIDFLRLRRAGLFALTSSAAFVLALLLFSDRVPTALARLFNPFADIPPASGVDYTVWTRADGQPGDDQVLREEDVVFTARVTRGDPDRLYVELTSPKGARTIKQDLDKQKGNLWKFTLAGKLPKGFEDQFSYRVYGGGTWSKRYRVTMVERPRITGIHTVLHYPEYMALAPEKRLNAAQTAEVTGPQGGQVEVVVQAEGDVSKGEVQLLKARMEDREVKNRVERVWFEKEFPAGASDGGVSWTWNAEAFEGRKYSHTEEAGDGERGHWFRNAKSAFQVQPGENLFAYVYLVPKQVPESIMLEWHDAFGTAHQAYWGAEGARMEKMNSACYHAGSLPKAGRWVRLEVPAHKVGLDGKVLSGMGFFLNQGRCYWQCAGALPAGSREVRVLVPDKRFRMKHQGKGTWSGRFPLEGEGLYRVELRNELGHPNKTMKEAKYTALNDNPPQVVLDRPEGDLTLGKPITVHMAMKAFDDYGLKEVAVQYKRSGDADWTRKVIKRYAKPQRDDVDITTQLDLAALNMVLGDSLLYRVEAVDRKGQSTSSSEFTILLATGPNTAEQKLTEFEKTQDPIQEKLANLIAAQVKVQQGLKTVTAKFAPLTAKIKAARAEAEARMDPASAKLIDSLRSKLNELATEKARAKEAGLAEPKPIPNQPEPALDAESKRVLDEATGKLTELAREREKNAGLQPSPQGPKLDAESRKVLEEMKTRLAELARQKAHNARAGLKPLAQPAKETRLDPQSKQLLGKLQKKLGELDDEKAKNTPRAVNLDNKSAEELAAMQKELAGLTGQQQQNTQQGEQIAKDLGKGAEDANKMPLLKGEVAKEMKALQQMFEKQAVQAMKNLAQQMNQAATARKEAPPRGSDLERMLQKNERLRQNLEELRKRMQALAKARKNMLNDPNALKELKNEMTRLDGQLTAQELKELKEHLAKLEAELKRQKGEQEKLKDKTGKAKDDELAQLEREQQRKDREVTQTLDRIRKLQDSDKMKRLNRKRKLNLPKAPYSPEEDEEKVKPKEDDSDEPLPKKDGEKAGKNDPAKKGKKRKADEDDDDEKRFLPQLGGKKQKIDPRYAKKMPKHAKRKNGEPADPSEQREDLEGRQNDNLRNLDSAQKSAEADEQTIGEMLAQMMKAMQGGKQGKGQPQQGQLSDQAAQQLAQMMQSAAMQQAMAMAARMQQGQGSSQRPRPQQGRGNPMNSNPVGGGRTGPVEKADLSKLDPATRNRILNMQPKLREELLQGMRNKGPEGYERHIQEYYKRLLKLKGSK